MCGHVGIAGDLAHKDEATMKRLLMFDYFRGPDSTGFAGIKKDGTTKISKVPSHPVDLFDMKSFGTACTGFNSTVFLGHNRAATRGVINTSNAHPYQFGDIIGAHNGTLDMSSYRALEQAVGEEYPTDSMAIFAAIDKLGIEETAPLLQGAWSLVWYDGKDKSLNFLRNKERPMWFGWGEGFDRLYWASEWPTIDASVRMSPTDIKMYTEDKTGHKYWPTELDAWYQFDLEELRKKKEEMPVPIVKTLKGKEPKPAVTHSCGVDPFQRATGQTAGSTTTSTTSLGATRATSANPPGKTQKEPLTIVLEGSPESPLAGFIDKAKFDVLAKYGCSWCGATVEYGDAGVAIFEKDEAVLCSSCVGGDGESSRIVSPRVEVLV